MQVSQHSPDIKFILLWKEQLSIVKNDQPAFVNLRQCKHHSIINMRIMVKHFKNVHFINSDYGILYPNVYGLKGLASNKGCAVNILGANCSKMNC